MELTTPDLSRSWSHFEAEGGCCLAIAGQVERQCRGYHKQKQLPILGRRTVNEERTSDWTAWGCCWELADEVKGADRRTSEDLLPAANELLLFFFSVNKVARARCSDLKMRFSSSESSARSCFLYSSTVNQPDSDLSARRMCFWRSSSNFSPSSNSDLTNFQAVTSVRRTWRCWVSLLTSDWTCIVLRMLSTWTYEARCVSAS